MQTPQVWPLDKGGEKCYVLGTKEEWLNARRLESQVTRSLEWRVQFDLVGPRGASWTLIRS